MTNIIENNEARIRKAKIEHQTKLGREDRAQRQTDQVSHKHHGIHLNPSYKQFTYILADSKKKRIKSAKKFCVPLYWIFNDFRNYKLVQRYMLLVQKRKRAVWKQETFASNYRNWWSCRDFPGSTLSKASCNV